MRRQHRQPQTHSKFGQGHIAFYIPGEEWQVRHQRRYELAVAHRQTVEAWCDFRGIVLNYKAHDRIGEYYSWDFRLPDRFARWTPYPGYLVYKRYTNELLQVVRCYDVEQLLIGLENWWHLPRPTT